MSLGLMAFKIGMTQIFVEDGVRIPVTVLKIEPNIIIAKKNNEKDGYSAIKLGAGSIKQKLLTKADCGQFSKYGLTNYKRHVCEYRASPSEIQAYEIGSEIGIEFFSGICSVDVSAISKGKGFAGVMKRHNFSGFPRTHGTHEFFRHGGSIGMRSKPGKVFKGKRMPGRMGNEAVYVKNLRIIRIISEENLLLVRGAVPGPKRQLVKVYISDRKPRALPGISGQTLEEGSKNPMKASKAGNKTGGNKSPAQKKK